MKMGMKKEREGDKSFSLSVLFSVFYLNPKPEPFEFRVVEFRSDWSVELDRVGTIIVPTQFNFLTLSHPNQTSPNQNLVLKLAPSLSYFPSSFPIPFPDFITLHSPPLFPFLNHTTRK
ncbi:MAG: hypothetical protein KHX69_13345 [Clostridium sp.]|nr:hypothetical protein [Clostridium sp.]